MSIFPNPSPGSGSEPPSTPPSAPPPTPPERLHITLRLHSNTTRRRLPSHQRVGAQGS